MHFEATPIPGVFLITLDQKTDERGHFARLWCRDELVRRGLTADLAQCNISFNRCRGTLRGMHWQAAPHEEAKMVRCNRGALYDVVLDLRPQSPSYQRWFATELSQDNARLVYIPEGCAHGFQTLQDNTEILYFISVPYAPASARGVRWNDPAFGIVWPAIEMNERSICKRDQNYSEFAASPTP